MVSQYVCAIALLFFGWRRAYQIVLFTRNRLRPRAPVLAPAPLPPVAERPRVCIQCPVYNEPDMIENLLDCVARLDWPREALEIQVLDDSDDATSERIAAWLRERCPPGLDVQHVRRDDREGFKAGALAYGMTLSQAKFFAIFDADFRPQPDFLEALMPPFQDANIGAVQARWEFVNRHENWITLTQSILLDPHFHIEQPVRHDSGLYFTFNGTAGIWRRAAIEASGGWQSDTMTEDFDLSYRAQLAGWRLFYHTGYAVNSELPPTMTAFKAQQTRWTRGSLQVFKKLIRATAAAKIPFRVKLEAFHHLAIGLIHPILVLTIATNIPSLLAQQSEARPLLSAFQLAVAGLTGGSVLLYYLMGQFVRKQSLGKAILYAALTPLLLSISLGLSLTTGIAAFKGLASRGGVFVRTPKGSLASRLGARWSVSAKMNFYIIILAETVFGLLYLNYGFQAFRQGLESVWPYFFFLSFGMLTLAITTISELSPLPLRRKGDGRPEAGLA